MTGKEQAKEQIAQLIEKYEKANKQGLNEANTRKDYILPLFASLGWRIDDSSEVAEEVKVGRDWADYAFKLGGVTRFYLEAKKAGADLENVEFAHQAVSYAYNKGASWAVLTNFEGLKLFNAEWDVREVNTLRVLDLPYSQYLERFDDLWTLSRESVDNDGIRARFEHLGGTVRKRLRVDERLFGLLKEWRLKLIRLFVQYQPPDTPLRLGEIDEAVQRILDRLIFIRTVEDRKIEDPILSPIHHQRIKGQGKVSAWDLLQETFRRLDDTYNSNLFADHLADHLPGDESAFLPILSQLYSPDGAAFRFDFSAIEADVLGRVYEQYLGHVIETVKTPTKRGGSVSYGSGDQLYIPGMQPANRELVEAIAKQAKRKQQGIYYTPKYIVDYIVEQTLGRLLEERGGDRTFVESIAVLDPACGSGSFLIAAYDRLLKHYADVRQMAPEHLNQDERVEILLRHIYGVDLDPQAVEIARLNLLLRALKEPKLLPEMDKNIMRGNSLIGGNAKTLEAHFGPDWREMHPLNWEERFPHVMGRGGFDVVIGNPPYVLLQDQYRDDVQLAYFRSIFDVASFKLDTYHLFIERGIRLSRLGGRLSMIVPANLLTNNHLAHLRQFILEKSKVEHILVITEDVFSRAKVDSAILVLTSGQASAESFPVSNVFVENSNLQRKGENIVMVDRAKQDQYVLFTGSSGTAVTSLWDRISTKSTELSEIADVNFGKQLRDRKEFATDVIRVSTSDEIISPYKRCYTGRDVTRYHVQWANLVCLDDEVARRGGCWDVEKQNAVNKLLTRQIGEYPEFALDRVGYQCLNTMFMVNIKAQHIAPEFVLGVLNSKLIRSYWLDRFYDRRHTFPKIKGSYLEKLPIRAIDFSNPADVALHDRVVAHVEALLELHRRRHEATEHTEAWEEVGRQIGAEDAALDRLVYELYGLTEEEIAIVEGR